MKAVASHKKSLIVSQFQKWPKYQKWDLQARLYCRQWWSVRRLGRLRCAPVCRTTEKSGNTPRNTPRIYLEKIDTGWTSGLIRVHDWCTWKSWGRSRTNSEAFTVTERVTVRRCSGDEEGRESHSYVLQVRDHRNYMKLLQMKPQKLRRNDEASYGTLQSNSPLVMQTPCSPVASMPSLCVLPVFFKFIILLTCSYICFAIGRPNSCTEPRLGLAPSGEVEMWHRLWPVKSVECGCFQTVSKRRLSWCWSWSILRSRRIGSKLVLKIGRARSSNSFSWQGKPWHISRLLVFSHRLRVRSKTCLLRETQGPMGALRRWEGSRWMSGITWNNNNDGSQRKYLWVLEQVCCSISRIEDEKRADSSNWLLLDSQSRLRQIALRSATGAARPRP